MDTLRLFLTPTRLYLSGVDPTLSAPRNVRLLTFDRTVACPPTLSSITTAHPIPLTASEVLDIAGVPPAPAASAAPAPAPPVRPLLGGFLGAAFAPAPPPQRAYEPPEVACVSAVALLGAIAFTRGFYLIVATKREQLGTIAGHAVFSPRAVELVPVSFSSGGGGGVVGGGGGSGVGGEGANGGEGAVAGGGGGVAGASGGGGLARWLYDSLLPADPGAVAESRYHSLFVSLDLTKDFFYSHTLDLTNCMQRHHEALRGGGPAPREDCGFVWNVHPRAEFLSAVGGGGGVAWVAPLLHGFFRQVSLSLLGAPLLFTLLARRSRFFAGARYFKRGADAEGHVANEVESEQLLEDGRGALASYVQLRGSVPVHWTQRTAIAVPRPPIVLQPRAPAGGPARRHAAALLRRYGGPLLVLNLVKKREPRGAARERLLAREFSRAVAALNAELPPPLRAQYISIDYNAVIKSRRHNVLACLRDVGRWASGCTGFFFNGVGGAPLDAAGGARPPPGAAPPAPLPRAQPLFPSLAAALDEAGGAAGAAPARRGAPGSQLEAPAARAGVYSSPGTRFGAGAPRAPAGLSMDGNPSSGPAAGEGGGYYAPLRDGGSSYMAALGAAAGERLLAFEGPRGTGAAKRSGVVFFPVERGARGIADTGDPLVGAAVDFNTLPAWGDVSLSLEDPGAAAAASAAVASAAAAPAVPSPHLRRQGGRRGQGGSIEGSARRGAPGAEEDGVSRPPRGSSSGGRSSSSGGSRGSGDGSSVGRGGGGSDGENGGEGGASSDSSADGGARRGGRRARAAAPAVATPHLSPTVAASVPPSPSLRSAPAPPPPPATGAHPAFPPPLPPPSASAGAAPFLKLNEDDSMRPEPLRHFASLRSSFAGCAAAGACRYVVACAPEQAAIAQRPGGAARVGLAARLCDAAAVGGEGDYLYIDTLGSGAGGSRPAGAPQLQRGVLRTNCVDCLDRTNVAQVSVGAHFLALQLRALGVLSAGESLDPNGTLLRVCMELYEAHGDAIALQYGGSEANKKVTTSSHEEGLRHGDAAEGGEGGGGGGGGAPRRGGLAALLFDFSGAAAVTPGALRLASSGPAEILTSLQRYYSNSFTDSIKQASINVFLGVFQPRRVAGALVCGGASGVAPAELVEAGARALAAAAAGRGADPLASHHVWEMDSDYLLPQPYPDEHLHLAPPEVPLGGGGSGGSGGAWWAAALAAAGGDAAARPAPPPQRPFPPPPPPAAPAAYTYFDAVLSAPHTAPQQVAHASAAVSAAAAATGGAGAGAGDAAVSAPAAPLAAAPEKTGGAPPARTVRAPPPPPPAARGRHTLSDPRFGLSLFADLFGPVPLSLSAAAGAVAAAGSEPLPLLPIRVAAPVGAAFADSESSTPAPAAPPPPPPSPPPPPPLSPPASPFFSRAEGAEYPHTDVAFPTPEGWNATDERPPPYLGLLPADEALYGGTALLAARLTGCGDVESLVRAAPSLAGGSDGGALARANIVTARSDIDAFRRSGALVAGAAGVRHMDALAPAEATGSGGGGGGGGGGATALFATAGAPPLPAAVRDVEAAQARALADLLGETLSSGPFAGAPRRRAAAPLLFAAFRDGERVRAQEYARYLGGGGAGRDHLVKAPVCPVPALLLRT